MAGLQAIYLRVYGPTLNPDTVSRMLGLAPTHRVEPGVHSHIDLDGSVFESRRDGQWMYRWDADMQTGTLVPQIERRVDALEAVGQAWRTLTSHATAELCLGITPALNDAFALTRAEMPGHVSGRMRALGLRFAIRVEYPDDADQVADDDA